MSRELDLLLKTIEVPSPVRELDYRVINWERCLISASQNKLLYSFSKRLLGGKFSLPGEVEITLREIISYGEKLLREMKEVIHLIQNNLAREGITSLFFKTKKNHPYVLSDIDLLVREEDFAGASQVLEKEKSFTKSRLGIMNERDIMGEDKVSFRVGNYLPQNLWQRGTKQAGPIKVDIHRKPSWGGRVLFDSNLIWKNIRRTEICGARCPIPSKEIEALSIVASLIFDRRSIPLLEFLNLKELVKEEIDWNILLGQAERYNWERELLYFFRTLNELNKKLFPKERKPLLPSQILGGISEKIRIKEAVNFPYRFPPNFALGVILGGAKKNFKATLFNLLYYLFSTTRYYLTGRRVTGWGSWFPLENFKRLRA